MNIIFKYLFFSIIAIIINIASQRLIFGISESEHVFIFAIFTGTVAGMIFAFDAIAAANDISPAVVAVGISQALLTTAFGLIVAMIIQIAQNLFSSMIDGMVLDMEERSIEITDLLRDSK